MLCSAFLANVITLKSTLKHKKKLKSVLTECFLFVFILLLLLAHLFFFYIEFLRVAFTKIIISKKYLQWIQPHYLLSDNASFQLICYSKIIKKLKLFRCKFIDVVRIEITEFQSTLILWQKYKVFLFSVLCKFCSFICRDFICVEIKNM